MNKTFLSPDNSLLLLVDYQQSMIKGVGSGDRLAMRESAMASAKAAQILNIPVILTTINPKMNGDFFKEISDLFPGKEVIARSVPSFDAFDDPAVSQAITDAGRTKLVISGLWTSMCFAFTALTALGKGMEVYGIMDAAGDATPQAHKYGVERMVQAGVVPTTWITLVSEWMHDWKNPKAGELVTEVYSKYNATIGI
jgi:nicotinamidase-related amidase